LSIIKTWKKEIREDSGLEGKDAAKLRISEALKRYNRRIDV